MTKAEQLTAVAQRLSDEQIDALLSFARAMAEDVSFYDQAPPEALASLERGLGQIARGEHVSLDELSRRLKTAADPTSK
jgi:predicted transcriptional regulator